MQVGGDLRAIAEAVCRVQRCDQSPALFRPEICAARSALIEFWRESGLAVSVHALFILYYTQIGSGVGATVLR